jgi:hypothetical protein
VPTYRISERRTEIWTHKIYIDADSEEEARRIWQSHDYDPDPEPEHQYDDNGEIQSIEED